MGTKNKPGTYDCYANAHPDEPMFVLLGRDPNASRLVDDWATMRESTHGPSAKVEEARACAAAMRAWRDRPDEVDVSGMIDRGGRISYMGKATKQPDGSYQCLADVEGALCIVEVRIRFGASELPGESTEKRGA